MRFDELCVLHRPWAVANFGTLGDGDGFPAVTGISEELGEYAEGLQKGHRGECLDALADMVIFLADFVGRSNVPGLTAADVAPWGADESAMLARVNGTPLVALTIATGNLSHAYLKYRQGIRGNAEEREWKVRRACQNLYGTVAWTCLQVHGVELEGLIEGVWGEVSARDWKAQPMGPGRG